MQSRVTVVLVPGADDGGAITRTFSSLAGQVPAMAFGVVSMLPVRQTELVRPALEGLVGLNGVDVRQAAPTGRPSIGDGDWVAVVAVGDRWPPGRMSKALAAGEDADALYSDVLLARGAGPSRRRFGAFAPVPAPERLLDGLLETPCVPASSLVVGRTVWDDLPSTPRAGAAWDLDLLLQLVAAGARVRRLVDELPLVSYPTRWTHRDRLAYLLGAIAAYGAAAAALGERTERAERALRRQAEARAELLTFSRYHRVSRRDRLALVGKPEVGATWIGTFAQVAAAAAPGAVRHHRPGLVNVRPRTSPMDFLARQPLHDCSSRPSSLCRRSPLVTVAIPSYNHGQFLAGAINSALSQTHQAIEVVVVDDGSTDHTPEVVASFGDAVRSYRRENAGLASTRNFAASVASGEFLLYLDADDELHPIYVEELLGAYCDSGDDPSLGFVYSQMAVYGRESRITWYPDYDPTVLRHGNFVNSAALLRRRVFEDAAFDPELRGLEDWEFYLCLADRGWFGKLVDLPLLRYRTHASMTSMSDQIRSERLQRSLVAHISERHPGVTRRPALREVRVYEAYVDSAAV